MAIRRFARRLGLDRNPMRRRIDRAQTAIGAGLLLLYLVLAPLLAVPLISLTYQNGLHAEQRQSADRHLVTATVLGDGELASGAAARIVHQTVWLRWQPASGPPRVEIDAREAHDVPGAHRRVWIDAAGNLTHRPRSHAQTIADASMAGVVTVSCATLPSLGLYALTRRRLDRRRYAQWDADWIHTAPLWTRRP
ncbi:MAG TPA: hypothetical protein VNW94_20910 [Streptosporangiaceae bacterium]|jgi:hypothetical protein|nr:hypothetical protein [Streptosporangiaceae bacterium]